MTLDLTQEEISLLTQSLVIVTQAATRPDVKPLEVADNLEKSVALIRKLNPVEGAKVAKENNT